MPNLRGHDKRCPCIDLCSVATGTTQRCGPATVILLLLAAVLLAPQPAWQGVLLRGGPRVTPDVLLRCVVMSRMSHVICEVTLCKLLICHMHLALHAM